MQNRKVVDWAIFILLSIIWGSSFILMKWSREGLNGVQIGALRIAFAGAVFLPFALFHIRHFTLRTFLLALLSGMLGNLLPAFLFAIAIDHHIDSSLAGILNSLTPLLVVVLGVLFFQTSLPRNKVIGVVIGFAGLLLLTVTKGGVSLQHWGWAALIFLATLLYAINVHLVGRYLKGINPLHLASISLAGVGLIAGIVALQQQSLAHFEHYEATRRAVAATAILGIMGSAVATLLYYILIKRAGGLFASLVTYAVPVVAIGWGIVAHETVTLLQVGCLGMILGGVWISARK
jgi:drug/metabolite transporter (DMT)-like permease